MRPHVARSLAAATATFIFIAAACTDSPRLTEPSQSALLSKGGKQTSPPPIYVHVAWDDGFAPEGIPAGIRGDGRQADGSTGPSAIQGGLCGVNAQFYDDGSGGKDAIFEEYTATGCGALRVHYFYFEGAGGPATAIATKSNARDLWSLAVGESRTDKFEGFQVGSPTCQRVMYDAQYPGITNPKRTRLSDLPNGARQWRIESQPPHQGVCIYPDKNPNKTVVGATTAPMPFAFVVTEVK